MKILTRYVLKEMIGPTALGFGFYTSIILMKSLFDLAEMIIRRSLPVATVGKLLLLSVPHIVVLTVPMSLLFGILIAIGRLSSDSEIIAMRALGISTRTIYRPVFLFSFVIFLFSLWLMNDVLPKGNSQLTALTAEIFTSTAEKEIKPRVFYDDFDNVMIYVDDVDPRTGKWKGVFVADSRADESLDSPTPQKLVENGAAARDRLGSSALGHSGQKIIVARRGNLSIIKSTRQIWINLQQTQTHVWDPRKPEQYDLNKNASQRILLPERVAGDALNPSMRIARSLREMTLRELLEQASALRYSADRETYRLAQVEIHKKFAIPFACVVFGVLGLPLGITNRRGGKSSGFSLSIAIILFYYVLIINGEHLATNGNISPVIGMWAPNLVLLALGIYLLGRANRDAGAEREGGIVKRIIQRIAERRALPPAGRSAAETAVAPRANENPSILNSLDITFPNIIDRYIIREFLKVLALVALSTIAVFAIVDYTDLSRDIRANHIAFHTVFAYYRFTVFEILNWTLPISVLVSTLVTFGLLAKNNEVTAIKSSGVSLFRIAVPILGIAAILSVLSYLMLDFVLPYSSQRALQLRNRIKGKKAIAASSQQRQWVFGKGRYLINFLAYDRAQQELRQVQVFELHPTEFRLTRRVYAQKAKWDGQGWVFENGWMRSFTDTDATTLAPITMPIRLYYAERPEDFQTDVKPPEQMTFSQLRRYIETIRRSGYAAESLSVKLYQKTSWPAISLVMAMIALPFAFKIGKRGALYGFGVALILGIVYYLIFATFTKFGEVGNLPPLLSAWSANILFAISALYLFLHVET